MKNLDTIIPVSDEGLYPIRTVSEISGVNSITLRAWERRYNIVTPKRTPKGHRLYSDKDIQRIHQVLALLVKGVSIGRVAKALNENSNETISPSIPSVDATTKKLSKKEWQHYQSDLLSKIGTYDILELERFHHDLLSSQNIETVSNNLILPVLKTLKTRAKELKSLSGEHHFYKAFILHRIGGIFLKSSIQNNGKKILLMGIASEHCEVELLLLAMPLLKRGYQIVNLGCNISLDAIPLSISASRAEGLLLYSSSDVTNKITTETFNSIVEGLKKPVFITGHYSKTQENQLSDSGLITLPLDSNKQFVIIDKI